MPKPREPIELIQAKGLKHLTKAEIKERMETEPCLSMERLRVFCYQKGNT